jgi:hypothetical protein
VPPWLERQETSSISNPSTIINILLDFKTSFMLYFQTWKKVPSNFVMLCKSKTLNWDFFILKDWKILMSYYQTLWQDPIFIYHNSIFLILFCDLKNFM